jgi:hypothetical protein
MQFLFSQSAVAVAALITWGNLRGNVLASNPLGTGMTYAKITATSASRADFLSQQN